MPLGERALDFLAIVALRQLKIRNIRQASLKVSSFLHFTRHPVGSQNTLAFFSVGAE